jgi:hypothetical protein
LLADSERASVRKYALFFTSMVLISNAMLLMITSKHYFQWIKSFLCEKENGDELN